MQKSRLTIGLLREGKVPPDKRVPFTPLQVEEIHQRFPDVKIVCQSSDVRAFRDEEYKERGIEVWNEPTCSFRTR
jgi:saccharopine dehydrogenase (NAD+, L-lysine-forming)